VTSTAEAMTSKREHVKSLFEVPEKYLGPRKFDIRIRVETVQEFTSEMRFDRILDIGCGNGAISLPLLPRSKKLTLLDMSTHMLDLARTQIPSERLADVDLINGDFLDADLEPHSFDLICCIGILAHVDSPAAVIAKVSRLAKPNAMVILEFTDSFHFWGVPVVIYQKLLKLARPEPYALNRLKKKQIMGMCEKSGLGVAAEYRYGLPPIGSSKLFNQEQMYRATRYLFGSSDNYRNAWMGNQFIYRLQKGDNSGTP
jgi:2-polyprenyl-3-methyl-5-hydroxy-6-metoxy-1,4-benzoquinol methylase